LLQLDTRREAKPPAKPPSEPAKQPQSGKHNTHASNPGSDIDLPILELTRLSQNYVPLPSKQRAAEFHSIHFRILLSALKSDDCIALGLRFTAISWFNLSAKAAKRPSHGTVFDTSPNIRMLDYSSHATTRTQPSINCARQSAEAVECVRRVKNAFFFVFKFSRSFGPLEQCFAK
jgi:hypothetical protein